MHQVTQSWLTQLLLQLRIEEIGIGYFWLSSLFRKQDLPLSWLMSKQVLQSAIQYNGPALDVTFTNSSTTMKLSLLPQGSPGKGRLVGQRAHCMSCPKRRFPVVALNNKFAQV